MLRCHTGDVSTFIQSKFNFTSDLYSLPHTYTIYLGQYGFYLEQYGFHLGSIQKPMQLINKTSITARNNLTSIDRQFEFMTPSNTYSLVDGVTSFFFQIIDVQNIRKTTHFSPNKSYWKL